MRRGARTTVRAPRRPYPTSKTQTKRKTPVHRTDVSKMNCREQNHAQIKRKKFVNLFLGGRAGIINHSASKTTLLRSRTQFAYAYASGGKSESARAGLPCGAHSTGKRSLKLLCKQNHAFALLIQQTGVIKMTAASKTTLLRCGTQFASYLRLLRKGEMARILIVAIRAPSGKPTAERSEPWVVLPSRHFSASVRGKMCEPPHSHSIVAGGFDVIS